MLTKSTHRGSGCIGSGGMGMLTRQILNCKVNVTRSDATVERINCALDRRTPLRIAFVNTHLANIAAGDPVAAGALEHFDLLNDGLGVDIASLVLYGQKFPENLNGTDFVPFLLDRLRPGVRLYLLGGTQKVIEATSIAYRRRWPQHSLVGQSHGFFSTDEEPALANHIRLAKPDLILVGMGNPRQELWLAQHIPDVCPVGIAVGALFDFQAGAVPRAPEIIRGARLEWVFRLAIEPRRLWRRYLIGNISFFRHLAIQWTRAKLGSSSIS